MSLSSPGGRSATRWTVRCLGPTALVGTGTGQSVPLSPLQRRLLAVLVLRRGRASGADALVDALWADSPPRSARASLHNQISRIRSWTSPDLILSAGGGYSIDARTDIDEFEHRVAHGLATAGADSRSALAELDRALALWHGTPFIDIEHQPDALGAARSLVELRSTAELARIRLLIDIGDPLEAVAAGERLVAESPIDERRWVSLAEALESSGRRGDALATIARATRALRDHLGVSPGTELSAIHRRLLWERTETAVSVPARPVGREPVVARIVSILDGGTSVILTGEDGIGRSTVAREVWRVLRRRGVHSIFVTVADPSPSPTAVLDDILEELGLPLLTGIDAVAGFVHRVTKEAQLDRVVLIVDDLDGAGPSTLSALDQCERSGAIRVVGVTGLHDGVPPTLARLHVEVIEPLDDDAVRSIVGEVGVLRGGIDGATTDALVSAAGGNPLLLGHLLHATGTPPDASTGPHDRDTVPRGLVAAVDRLLAPHGPAVRRAIDTAAVIGRVGPVAIWEQLTSSIGVAGALSSGLIERRDATYRFRHGAVARVRAAALSESARTDIQRAFADAARHRQLPVLSYATHSLGAAVLDARRAFDDCMAAGGDSSARGMHHDAHEWFVAARGVAGRFLGDDPSSALRARIRAGDALRLCGDPLHVPELLACAEESLRLGDHGLVADAAYALLQFGGTSQTGDAQQRALRHARRAMRVLDGTEQWALIAAATTLTTSLFHDPTASRRMFERSLVEARDPQLRLRILPYAYMTYGHPRDLGRRDDTAAELLALALEHGNPSALFSAHHQHWANALVRGDEAAVRRHHDAMSVLVERIGTVGVRWEMSSSMAARLIAEGDLGAAELVAREAHDLLAPVMSERAAAVLVSHLFAIRLRQGRLAELEPALGSVVARQPGVGALRALWAATLVEVDPERAVREALAAAPAVHEDFTWLAAQWAVGEVVARTRRANAAHRMLAVLQPWQHLHAAPLTCSFGRIRDVVHRLEELAVDAR